MAMNLRDALREARNKGMRIEVVRRTGEIRIHASTGRPLTMNGRRKDAPLVLMQLLKKGSR